jgi:hypothetical protein
MSVLKTVLPMRESLSKKSQNLHLKSYRATSARTQKPTSQSAFPVFFGKTRTRAASSEAQATSKVPKNKQSQSNVHSTVQLNLSSRTSAKVKKSWPKTASSMKAKKTAFGQQKQRKSPMATSTSKPSKFAHPSVTKSRTMQVK